MIDINNETEWELDELSLQQQARFVLDRMRIHPGAELSIVLVDTEAMAELHERWMDEPGPTDVLAFPMDEITPGGGEDVSDHGMLGDVVVCPDVAAQQADTAGHPLRDELGILLTHGILHLLGYDHAEPDEQRLMFGLQGQLIAEWNAQASERS